MIDNRLQLPTLELEIDTGRQAIHVRFLHPGRPVMSARLLEDFATAQRIIDNMGSRDAGRPGGLRYLVVSSALPGVFSLGGDLALFLDLIERGDREGLARYGHTCVELLYRNLAERPGRLCSISLVQGEALGGGFETALGADVLIAERQARFGFPELQFGLFPGMGAFSLLARRINPALARRLITSGRIYSAEELHEMGVVDFLAEEGRGRELLHHYLDKRRDREAGYSAVDSLFNAHTPIPHAELKRVVEQWVNAAFSLSPKNLAMMRYLLRAQQKRWGEVAPDGEAALRRA